MELKRKASPLMTIVPADVVTGAIGAPTRMVFPSLERATEEPNPSLVLGLESLYVWRRFPLELKMKAFPAFTVVPADVVTEARRAPTRMMLPSLEIATEDPNPSLVLGLGS